MLLTHVSVTRTSIMVTTTATIRLVRRLIFEDVEVAAGNEDGVGELVALAERA